jgi:hypothetical protein
MNPRPQNLVIAVRFQGEGRRTLVAKIACRERHDQDQARAGRRIETSYGSFPSGNHT